MIMISQSGFFLGNKSKTPKLKSRFFFFEHFLHSFFNGALSFWRNPLGEEGREMLIIRIERREKCILFPMDNYFPASLI